MKDLFVVVLIAMGVFFFLGVVFQILQHRRKPEVRYICSSCGEKECQCYKEEKAPLLNSIKRQEEQSK